MSFATPALLWLLLLIPAAVALYIHVQKRRMRFAVRFTNLDILASVAGDNRSWRRLLPPLLFLLGLAALLLGVARPQADVLVPREQATIVMVMDVSGSMRASDVEPTRLAAAQDSATAFVEQLPDKFQVGVVTFSDDAQILSQPTTDRTVIGDAIASLRADGGTAMGDAIMEALMLAPNDDKGGRSRDEKQRPLDAVLLLSDGKNTSGEMEPLEAAARARSKGIPVYTIALGTPEGVISARDRFGIPRTVAVPPDFETLERIAELTEAQAYNAPSDDELRAIYENLGSRIGFVKDHEEVTVAFAAAGLLLAALAGVLSFRWSGRFP